jgi:hypothetical protein
MNDEKPLLSVEDSGIEINLKKGDSIKTNADKTLMQGVKQNIEGGELEHRAEKELIQTGNQIKVTDGGKIINEVQNGTLKQTDNSIEVDGGGTIINKISSDPSAQI